MDVFFFVSRNSNIFNNFLLLLYMRYLRYFIKFFLYMYLFTLTHFLWLKTFIKKFKHTESVNNTLFTYLIVVLTNTAITYCNLDDRYKRFDVKSCGQTLSRWWVLKTDVLAHKPMPKSLGLHLAYFFTQFTQTNAFLDFWSNSL